MEADFNEDDRQVLYVLNKSLQLIFVLSNQNHVVLSSFLF